MRARSSTTVFVERILLHRLLVVVTVAMSFPLFFTFQLKHPPDFLEGLPFIILWSWGILAAVSLPILVVIDVVICSWLLWQRPRGAQSALQWHGVALVIAIVAEIVFVIARGS
jgi:hypothetical protein